ncbi:2-amino-3,7-dideoxy-D-threo-hept-6-ulosonate synthase [Nocardiopsis sp. RSe5-2]|uniref:2-amino-3,7-dideoxy-D-threo-hept-6-ulosonate synthase n=1 Tax=Nocardiopsis endophytica TaxID=3018445 RepID=A0ABT4U376_9ACTN|nr:2-amino-3,7-dideoxy-D-threo-hept-6-ulosonate synthase [Nocardiopsis endophytica]MDA2811408.1 2-amino-3,7-dideoxy-D-threo-hept-6-ulosonate synthase [Nocardiopsis endophytica]
MTPYRSSAALMRLRRLHRHGDDRLFVVPLDHSVADGPIVAAERLDPLVGTLTDNGVDAVVLHKGRVPFIDPARFAGMRLVVHLSASTGHAPDPDAKYLVASVEAAVRMAADAVSVHVNLGSDDERRQIADLGAVAEACREWSVPLLAMVYPRGPRVVDPRDPALLAHAASLATDLGADIVKLPSTARPDEMADVVRQSALPVITAGGPVGDEAGVHEHVRRLLEAGTSGVAMGRNVFWAADPGRAARRLAEVVHPCLRPGLGARGGPASLPAGV